MTDIKQLREIAEKATRGAWVFNVESWSYITVEQENSEVIIGNILGTSNARHIVTFDPPTVLALLDRVEKAEHRLSQVSNYQEDIVLPGTMLIREELNDWKQRAKQAEAQLAHLKRVAATGEADAFMALSDDDKRAWFVLSGRESERRKGAEAELKKVREALNGPYPCGSVAELAQEASDALHKIGRGLEWDTYANIYVYVADLRAQLATERERFKKLRLAYKDRVSESAYLKACLKDRDTTMMKYVRLYESESERRKRLEVALENILTICNGYVGTGPMSEIAKVADAALDDK